MKIFVYSIGGDACGLAQQMAQEGHQVMLYIEAKEFKPRFEGLVWKTEDWESAAKEADFTIFDYNGRGERADKLREMGCKVWNGGKLADRLEFDRQFGMNVFSKAGIPIPETFHFSSGDEALSIVHEKFQPSDRCVIKLDSSAGTATSYVAKDLEDMDVRITSWMESSDEADLSKGGIIQKFIEGVEISIEGWFDGRDFLYPYNITMEDKKLLNGDKGPNTGCSQNVVKQLKSRHPKLARLMLEPLVPFLRKGKFIGQIDVNTIVSEEDGSPYALEFTPRPGYDATPTLVLGLPGYGEAVARALGIKTCGGQMCKCLAVEKVSEGDEDGCRCLTCGADRPWIFLGAVRTYIPPYPFESTDETTNRKAYEASAGVPIEGWVPENRRVVLYDAAQPEDKLVTSGCYSIPLIALGHGRSLDEMVEDTYKHLDSVRVPNLCYRTDFGERAKKAWPVIEHLLV